MSAKPVTHRTKVRRVNDAMDAALNALAEADTIDSDFDDWEKDKARLVRAAEKAILRVHTALALEER